MALPNNWPTRDPSRTPEDQKQPTEYRASRGGFYPVEEKPVPGMPQDRR